MAPALYLRRNLSEPGIPKALVLNGVADDTTTESVVAEIDWRWEDEPDMKPEPFGKTAAGTTLTKPFDLKGRNIRLYINSRTIEGEAAFSDLAQTPQTVFYVPVLPVLASVVFDTVDENELTIANNGGGGDISILRQIDSNGFFVIDTVPSSTTTYQDTLVVDGTYHYKLSQAGITGFSNEVDVVVTGVAAGAGSPPSALSAVFDNVDTTDLAWTNNGGTGNVVIERKTDAGDYIIIDSVSSATTTYADSTLPGISSHIYYYRVRNESVAGYSNLDSVYVPSA